MQTSRLPQLLALEVLIFMFRSFGRFLSRASIVYGPAFRVAAGSLTVSASLVAPVVMADAAPAPAPAPAPASVQLDPRAQQAFAQLQALFGDRYEAKRTDGHGKSANSYHASSYPTAVIFPLNTSEVSQALKICHEHHIPVIPFGAGTSLEGQISVPSEWPHSLCIDMSQMDHIVAIRPDDLDATVQPGVGWMNLNAACKEHGLFLAVDPGPGASVGGMVGTGCSGTLCIRHGNMQHHVVSMTVVRPDGRVVTTGRRPRKSSAGYHLAQLMVGSEGTLGIVTEITVRLTPIPESTAVILSPFKALNDATKATLSLLRAGISLSCVELCDDVMVRGMNNYSNLGIDNSPTLFIKVTGHTAQVQADLNRAQEVLRKHEAITKNIKIASNEADIEAIWHARKGALWAAFTLRPDNPNVRPWTTDVAVPLSRLAQCIEETQHDIRQSFLVAPIVGHVGDGNFHVLIMVDSTSPTELAEAKRLNARMIERALAMGGTCTGEHGVGTGKKPFLEQEVGEEAIQLMRDLKLAMDPHWIMNPGKVFDQRPGHSQRGASSDAASSVCGCL